MSKRTIDNYIKDNIYIYKYNNRCNAKCPNNTYLAVDNNYICHNNYLTGIDLFNYNNFTLRNKF